MRIPFMKKEKENKSVETKVDLTEILKIPNANIGPAPFETLAEFVALTAALDAHLAELFKGKMDAGNGNVLDNLIDEMAGKAIEDARAQYAAHLSVIENLNAQRDHDCDITKRSLDIDKAKRAEVEKRLKELNNTIIERDGVAI